LTQRLRLWLRSAQPLAVPLLLWREERLQGLQGRHGLQVLQVPLSHKYALWWLYAVKMWKIKKNWKIKNNFLGHCQKRMCEF
jgi:hypothetical protein